MPMIYTGSAVHVIGIHQYILMIFIFYSKSDFLTHE